MTNIIKKIHHKVTCLKPTRGLGISFHENSSKSYDKQCLFFDKFFGNPSLLVIKPTIANSNNEKNINIIPDNIQTSIACKLFKI